MKPANYILALLIIVVNVSFIPETYWTLTHLGGPYFSPVVALIFISVHFPLVTAMMVFFKRFQRSKAVLILNSLGCLWVLFLFYVVILLPLLEGEEGMMNIAGLT